MQNQGPELVVADGLAERTEKVVPGRSGGQIDLVDIGAGVLLLPGPTPGLPLEQRGDLVAENLADVGRRKIRRVEGGDATLNPEQRLLSRFLGEVAVADQQPSRFGADVVVDGTEQFAMGSLVAGGLKAPPQMGDFGGARRPSGRRS